MASELCRGRGCTCAARRDGFCSDYCAGVVPRGDGEYGLCACGHDECAAPTKAEGWDAVAGMAPEGRFINDPPPRDW